MNYKDYSDLSVDILEEIDKIPSDIQLIVSIPRSGIIPAFIIGTQLNLPVNSIDEYLNGILGSKGKRILKNNQNEFTHVLVVDDSIDSGNAMCDAKERIKALNNNVKHTYCAIYASNKIEPKVDLYLKYLPQPRVFQWNFKNHFISTQSCYDLDGVLCVNPTEEQNDDGKKYLSFILDAKPLFIPAYKISCIVTSRLEKYRTETELWLKTNKVNYKELIMLDLPSAEERRQRKIHAKFKAEVFVIRNEKIFVESNWKQAKTIFKIAKKPVFCTENDVFIKSNADIYFYENCIDLRRKNLLIDYYNNTHQFSFTNVKSIFFLLTPPILIKLLLKIKRVFFLNINK